MALIQFIAFCLSLIPRRLQWWMGSALGWLWWNVFRFRRFTLLRNITIAFPDLPKEERLRLIRRSLSWMGFNIFETLQIPRFNERNVRSRVTLHGVEHLEQALAQGKGVLLLSLHLGNGDLAAVSLPLLGHKIHLISKKFKVKRLNDVWFGMREAKGTRFIDPHGKDNAFQILKALRANEPVVFVIDQFMGRPYGIPTTFFGRPTATAYGLSLFAAKTRAPVLPIFTYFDEDLHGHVEFGPIIPFEEFADKDVQLTRMTQKYNSVLEQLITAHPEQWMWVHRRWKRWE